MSNIWIPKKIIEMQAPPIGMTVKGRVKHRALRVFPRFRDLVEELFQKNLTHLIDPAWFYVARETPFIGNLITASGLASMASTPLTAWNYYHAGTGLGTPVNSDTQLFTWKAVSSTNTNVPSSSQSMVHDYSNGRVLTTRAWYFPAETTNTVYTEGGLSNSAYHSASYPLFTKFNLATTFTVLIGEYYSPVYELEFLITPTTTSASISSPVVTGWATAASARVETLVGSLVSFDSTGSVAYDAAYALSDDGLSSFATSTGSPSSVQNNLCSVSGRQDFMWPLNGHESGGYPAYSSNSVYLSTKSDALSFGTTLFYPQASDIDGSNFTRTGANNSSFYEHPTAFGSAGWQAYTESSGIYSRVNRTAFNLSQGNLTGIRSFGICFAFSPLGSSYWRRASAYRVLLDSAMTKDSDHILTLDFTYTWH